MRTLLFVHLFMKPQYFLESPKRLMPGGMPWMTYFLRVYHQCRSLPLTRKSSITYVSGMIPQCERSVTAIFMWGIVESFEDSASVMCFRTGRIKATVVEQVEYNRDGVMGRGDCGVPIIHKAQTPCHGDDGVCVVRQKP